MLRQFDSLKQKHPDAMLLFRKGDFYEMYKEDAVKAATILAITLTSRAFPGEKAPVKYTLCTSSCRRTDACNACSARRRTAMSRVAPVSK